MPRPVDLVDFLKGSLHGNLGLKGLALVLAVALWWFVAGESKVQVGFAVPLEVRGVPQGFTITNKIDRQVEVHLVGPPSILGALQPAEVSASIDLSAVKAGRSVLPIQERSIKVPPGVMVQRIYPNTVEVFLEKLERRRVPVVARIGAMSVPRKIARIEVDPQILEVEALPEEFSRIRSLYAQVPAPEEGTEIVTENVRVELQEGHARIVGNPNVRVTIRFRK